MKIQAARAVENYIAIRYNSFMRKTDAKRSGSSATLKVLAEFRHQLRLFLHFSEAAAAKFDLQPQQHQLLLQIAGRPDGTAPTVGYAAERLGLRHNSVVELSMRCEEAGLIRRRPDNDDRRCILLELTLKGQRILESLSRDHARELNELAPLLIRTLTAIEGAHNQIKVLQQGVESAI
jgi:DNA-binding MarR family transcriptional regulator